jgi:hypothetical protein
MKLNQGGIASLTNGRPPAAGSTPSYPNRRQNITDCTASRGSGFRCTGVVVLLRREPVAERSAFDAVRAAQDPPDYRCALHRRRGIKRQVTSFIVWSVLVLNLACLTRDETPHLQAQIEDCKSGPPSGLSGLRPRIHRAVIG